MGKQILYAARAIRAIATNTFREAVRNKIFGAILLFAVGVMAFSLVMGAMSLHHEVRVATDVTIFASTVFSMLLTVYVSINLLHTEIERRTIYTILSKPVRRWQFLIGKFVGIALLMGTIVVLLFGLASGLRVMQGGEVTIVFGSAFLTVFFQLLITAAVSLLFASFSSPLLSGLLSAGIFLLGHLHAQLDVVRNFFEFGLLRRLIDFLKFFLPNLSSLNLTAEVVHDVPVPASYLLAAGWYTLSYTGIVLLLAIGIFSRRDLI